MGAGAGDAVSTLANILGYQALWFVAVWGAGRGLWWPAVLALLPFAAWTLLQHDTRAELRLMAAVLPLGLAMDSLMAASGLLHYAAPVPSTQLAPLWIAAIWAAFSLTLRHTFRFLFDRPWTAALFGAIGAPLAYLGAARGWGAVTFGHGEPAALAALAAMWALALPGMLALARRAGTYSTTGLRRGDAHV